MVALLLLGACSSDADTLPEGTTRVVDQSGAEFFWVCDDELTDCDVDRIAGVSPPLPPCGTLGEPVYICGWWRFLGIDGFCLHPGGGMASIDWGRALVCEVDEDCPEIEDAAETFECRAGFCQNTDLSAHPPGPPRGIDMELLCFGDMPRYEDGIEGIGVLSPTEKPAELVAALEAACPNASEACDYVPAACPDPT